MAVSGLNGTRFLVIVMLGDSSPSRLQTLVPRLQEVLAALSTEPTQQAFRSATADIFGYFLRSTLRAGQLLGRLETPGPAALSRQCRQPSHFGNRRRHQRYRPVEYVALASASLSTNATCHERSHTPKPAMSTHGRDRTISRTITERALWRNARNVTKGSSI
jgi:hypothetical protein